MTKSEKGTQNLRIKILRIEGDIKSLLKGKKTLEKNLKETSIPVSQSLNFLYFLSQKGLTEGKVIDNHSFILFVREISVEGSIETVILYYPAIEEKNLAQEIYSIAGTVSIEEFDFDEIKSNLHFFLLHKKDLFLGFIVVILLIILFVVAKSLFFSKNKNSKSSQPVQPPPLTEVEKSQLFSLKLKEAVQKINNLYRNQGDYKVKNLTLKKVDGNLEVGYEISVEKIYSYPAPKTVRMGDDFIERQSFTVQGKREEITGIINKKDFIKCIQNFLTMGLEVDKREENQVVFSLNHEISDEVFVLFLEALEKQIEFCGYIDIIDFTLNNGRLNFSCTVFK